MQRRVATDRTITIESVENGFIITNPQLGGFPRKVAISFTQAVNMIMFDLGLSGVGEEYELVSRKTVDAALERP